MPKTDFMRTPPRERLIGALGAAMMVGALGAALLTGLAGRVAEAAAEQPLVVLALPSLGPPPPPPPRLIEQARPRAAAHPAPRNLRNKPTEIVLVKPVVPLPEPPPVVTAPIAGPGESASAGASDRPGPGTGAGGEGVGLGGGGNGDGDGGDTPPRLIHGRLKEGDLPPNLREAGLGGRVGVRYDVGVDGRVSGCRVIEPSGQPELDRLTCALIEQRFRFKPSKTDRGEPVPSTIEESHEWVIDRPDPPQGG